MRRCLLLFLPAAFLLSALPGGAQRVPPAETIQRTFLLTGTLRYGDTGRGAEMVKVDLRRFTGEIISTAFTRSNGEFEFSGLARGNYYLIVEETDYEPVRESVEVVTSDRRGVLIYLNRVLKVETTAPGPMVTARQLGLPRKAREAYEKGRERLYDRKDSRGSLAFFQRAVAELPTFYEAFHEMGVAYLQMGLAADAENAFHRSIEISNNVYADPHVALAALLCNLEKYADAEAAARRGLEIDPSSWLAHYHLARALMGLNRVNDAEKSLRVALERKPDFSELYLLSANVYIRRQDYPNLLKALDDYLRLDPKGPMSASARGMRETVQKKIAAAQSAASSAKP